MLAVFVPRTASAVIYQPGATMDPLCTPSVLCTVYLGIDVGTTEASGFVGDALLFTGAGGVLQQSPELTFVGNFGLTLNGIMTLASATPATSTNSLYNLGGILHWNGAAVGTVIGAGAAGRVAYWDSSNSLGSDPNFVFDSSTYGFLGIVEATPVNVVNVSYTGAPANAGLRITGTGNGVATSSPTLTFLGTSSSVTMTQYADRFEYASPDASMRRYQWSSSLNTPLIQLSTDDSIPSFFSTGMLIGSSSQCGAASVCTNPTATNILTIWNPGTAALPALAFGQALPMDSDTGFFKPAQDYGPQVGLQQDTFSFTTAGVERIRFGTTTNSTGGNVTFGANSLGLYQLNDDEGASGGAVFTTEGRYDALMVGGSVGNAGITILDDVGAKFRIGRFAAAAPSSFTILGTTSERFAWRNNADTADIMHLSNGGGLLVGSNLGVTVDASSAVHVQTGAASTTNTIRLESEAEQVDWFVVEDNPNGSVIGSPSDIAVDILHGQLYIKRAGVGTSNNWVAFSVEATSTCTQSMGAICVGGNTFGTSTVIGASNTRDLDFETLNIVRARLTSQGDFNLGTTSSLRQYQIDGQTVLWNSGIPSSLALGVGAGAATLLNSAASNVLLGFNAGDSLTIADEGVIVGANSFTASTLNSATVLGAGSLTTVTGGNSTIIGRGAQNSTGGGSVTIGSGASAVSTSGSALTIGHYALNAFSTAIAVTALGNYAGYNFIGAVGTQAALLGHNAGFNSTNTPATAAIGNNALYNNATGSNFAIGHSALFNNTFGFANFAIGYQSLFNNTLGDRNVGIGKYTLFNNITGSSSLAIGENAGFSATSSDNNIAIGNSALYNNASSTNLAIGNFALTNNTYGSLNLAIGHGALFSNTLGTSSIAIGNAALYSATESYDNIAIGDSALYDNTSGEHNIAIGLQALNSNTTGSRNIAMGSSSLMNNVSGSDNMAFGLFALENNTASDNIAFGNSALRETTVGTDNIAFGLNALSSNVSGSNNIAMGKNTLSLSVSDSDNIALGLSAMIQAVGASSTIAIGNNALSGLLTGSNNVAVGSNALAGNTSGQFNIAFGADSLFSNTTGSHSIALGHGVLDAAVSANNIGIGSLSLGALTTGATNTAIGAWSLLSLTTGSGNIAIGSSTLSQATSSSDNIVIGSNAATTSIDATHRNILIGTGLGFSNPITSDSLNIGGVLQGFVGTHATPRIGIANDNPQTVLHMGSTTILDGVALIRTQDANSTCDFTAQGAGIACGSDRRLKKNITTDTKGLAEILGLRPVTYHWLQEDNTEELHTGFIAQEVEEILPELVTEREDGIKLLSAGGMMPTVVGAIQETQVKIETLRALVSSSNASTAGTSSDISVDGRTNIGGHVTLSNNQVGRARILAGVTSVRVSFGSSFDGAPVVVATPRGEIAGEYWIEQSTKNSFVIVIADEQDTDVVFDWHAFVHSQSVAQAPNITP